MGEKSMLLISARGVRRYLHRLYRSMDHPDGKMGITVHVWGEDLTFFGTMSPKKAMCLALFLGSTAFWIGTGIVGPRRSTSERVDPRADQFSPLLVSPVHSFLDDSVPGSRARVTVTTSDSQR